MERSDAQHPFGLEAFGRYQRGEMSAAEQHTLEKQLLEDPLTAEAYEGFLAMQENKLNAQAISESLENRLNDRIGSKQRKANWAYGAAASILVAAGAFWFGYVSKKPVDQRMETIATDTMEAPRLSATEPALPSAVPLAEVPSENPGVPEKSALATTKRKHQIAESAPQIASVNETEVIVPPTDASEKIAYKKPVDAPVATQEAGPQLPAAPPTVTIPERPFSASKTKPAGGLPQGMRIAANEKNTVLFDGVSSTQQRTMRPGQLVTDKDPAPVNGWKAYNQFLYESTQQAGRKGIVTVTFTVGVGGVLSGFYTIGEESLFAQATDLIQKGPGWSPGLAGGAPASKTVTITLHFEKE